MGGGGGDKRSRKARASSSEGVRSKMDDCFPPPDADVSLADMVEQSGDPDCRRFSAEVEGRRPWWLKVEGQRLSVHLARPCASRTYIRQRTCGRENCALARKGKWNWCSAS